VRRASSKTASVDDFRDERLPSLRPLAVFPASAGSRRYVNIITDSLGAGSLYGGVGTAMIVGALLADRIDATLRIVTRTEPSDPNSFATVLRAHGIGWGDDVEFLCSSLAGDAHGVPVSDGDVFLTTSWWTTWSALRSIDPASIVYLLQEDERLFYPSGDEQLLCNEVFADEGIHFLINTNMLFEHFASDGFGNIAAHGWAFEPAFPQELYFRQRIDGARHRTFFFYARPNNVRNLFLRGIEAINVSLQRGALNPDEWTFHFVGKEIPRVRLPYGVEPICSENMRWPDYAALIRRVDLGLSLMYSPHPSYPPLDLAACGAVAVTNRFGPKQSLEQYSANIICADPPASMLADAIAEGARLAADEGQRTANTLSAGLCRDWRASLAPGLDGLAGTL